MNGIKDEWATEDGSIRLLLGDCLEILPGLERGSVSLVCTDPPYSGVKDDDWDNQWATDSDFLEWVSQVCNLASYTMAPNGSIYWFASPQMADLVSVEMRKHFSVLNQIVWSKGDSRGGVGGTGIDVTALRRFWTSTSERIIFAERFGSDKPFGDALIDGNRTYWSACEETKRGIFGDYLRSEFQRAGVTQKQIAALFPSASGGLTGCVSNWLIGYNCPTPAQYQAMRDFLNAKAAGDGVKFLRREYEDLRREYEDLRREYEDLRREYEDLRREYEDLRRPFSVTACDEWGDVWKFPIERKQSHPTQKPVEMMSHIVKTSSRRDGLVLDPFMGSGTTGVACIRLGRKFIGIEKEPEYFEIAKRRIRDELDKTRLIETPKKLVQKSFMEGA